MDTTSRSRDVNESNRCFKSTDFFLLFTPGTIPIQGDPNGIQEILITAWLCEEFDRSRLDRANAHWNVAVAGEKDDRYVNVSGRKLALEIEPTQPWQSDVQHKATGNIWKRFVQKAVSGVKGF